MVVTEAELQSDQLLEQTICSKCNKCVNACPAGALTDWEKNYDPSTGWRMDKEKCYTISLFNLLDADVVCASVAAHLASKLGIVGTAVIAVGLMAIPALADTNSNSNGSWFAKMQTLIKHLHLNSISNS
ncbi:hypothetical protein UF75_5122 [Desulfosporosinus sp. I2]|uniref:4Fe-4S binding protein n=1 Tax=Desulfosporosinus sp. I2 TaxID=1617025 RepID=UPI00061F01A1|nr:4Fe-4S dicluster domain-containing protein [Desulfosporosinus sp. I2]KJR44489.1 hypothetical protein UF75_5122 [Desulfosporosinus sp. I2]